VLRRRSVSATVLERILEHARRQEPTYDEVGAADVGDRPAGYRHDRYQSRIGGPETFARAREALIRWRAHLGAGVRIYPSDPVREGATVLLLIAVGPWRMVAPCRIVSVIDEDDRFGFAYATLPGHPERGEELFVIEREDGGCIFRITASSRPDRFLVRLGAPVARRIQTQVTRRYLRALAHDVGEGPGYEAAG